MIRKGEERKRGESERPGTLGQEKGRRDKADEARTQLEESTGASEGRGRSVGPTEMGWS